MFDGNVRTRERFLPIIGSERVHPSEEGVYFSVMYYLYILFCHKTNTLYVGQSNNLEKRLLKYKMGEVRSTKNKLPVSLIYFEIYPTRSEVMKREQFFKSLVGSKVKNKILKRFSTDGSSKL